MAAAESDDWETADLTRLNLKPPAPAPAPGAKAVRPNSLVAAIEEAATAAAAATAEEPLDPALREALQGGGADRQAGASCGGPARCLAAPGDTQQGTPHPWGSSHPPAGAGGSPTLQTVLLSPHVATTHTCLPAPGVSPSPCRVIALRFDAECERLILAPKLPQLTLPGPLGNYHVRVSASLLLCCEALSGVQACPVS